MTIRQGQTLAESPIISGMRASGSAFAMRTPAMAIITASGAAMATAKAPTRPPGRARRVRAAVSSRPVSSV